MHISMRYIVVFFCMLCLALPISAALDENEDADGLFLESAELIDENVDDFGENVDDFEVGGSGTGPTSTDLKFAELLATRAAPAIFATGAAFDTAFYHGSEGALAAVARQQTMELNQAAGLIRSANISEQYEPIRTEFLSRMNSLLSEVKSGGELKQGCSQCRADIKRLKENANSFGIWTIDAISKIE